MHTSDSTKVCTKCFTEYPATIEWFSRSKHGLHGLQSVCKSCANARNRQWHKDNPEKSREIDRRKREAHPEKRIKTAERGRRWIEKNPDRKREVARNSMRRRRATLRAAKGKHTVQEIRELVAHSKGLCWWCGKSFGNSYQIDHRIPLARGGSDDIANLCVTCPSCNRHKNDKLPQEWNGRLL